MNDQIIDASTIYWITRLDALRVMEHILLASAIVAAVLGGIGAFLAIVPPDGDTELGKQLLRKLFVPNVVVALVLGVACVLTPTTKEAAAIYVVPQMVNSEQLQEEVGELYGLAKRWLEDQVPHKEPVDE